MRPPKKKGNQSEVLVWLRHYSYFDSHPLDRAHAAYAFYLLSWWTFCIFSAVYLCVSTPGVFVCVWAARISSRHGKRASTSLSRCSAIDISPPAGPAHRPLFTSRPLNGISFSCVFSTNYSSLCLDFLGLCWCCVNFIWPTQKWTTRNGICPAM